MNLQKYTEVLNKKNIELQIEKDRLNDLRAERQKYEKNFKIIQEALVTFQKASKVTQDIISVHISKIVTKALTVVFGDLGNSYKFKIVFVERRNTTEADFHLVKNKREMSILESSGYGVADIISFALRVAYVILSGRRRVLIFDEPFRHLDDERQPYAAQLVNQLSEELGIQFIIATHSKEFYAECKNIFKVLNKKNEATITKIN